MEIGILGLASSGKSTLFSLLTGHDAGQAGRRDSAVMGIARVPDDRLERLSKMFNPKKKTPAIIQYVDVPGISAEHGRDSSLNLPELRNMDALMVVVRAFTSDNVPHPMTSVDPARDLEHIEEEFVLQDQIIVEKRLERIVRDLAKRRSKALEVEQVLLKRCLSVLEEGRALRCEPFDAAEEKVLRGFTFLSLKPLLAVVNLDETEAGADPSTDEAYTDWLAGPKVAMTAVCATLEGELAELDAEDCAAFMEDLGISDSALNRVIEESYSLLGLISFFTVGEDECRAWSIPKETQAVEAAASIHSDIQRGFIRAEVVAWDELLDADGLAACRQRGTLRLEGKTYLVKDGEVVHFRFNV